MANMEDVVISGIALDKNQARVTMRNVLDKPGTSAEIFKALADKNINVDLDEEDYKIAVKKDCTTFSSDI